ncbi:MAG: Na/Pi cotransporter family protein [bacterium]
MGLSAGIVKKTVEAIGGLGLLMYGIQIMEGGLQKAAGDHLRKILKVLTYGILMQIIVGVTITAITQSSSATIIMLIGFVKANLISLPQSLGVILGANIGTTVTAQIIAFELSDYALPIIVLGFLLHLYATQKLLKPLGTVLFGFGLLFLGLGLMAKAIHPLFQRQSLLHTLLGFVGNPFSGLLVGATITGIMHSGSATMGIIIALASINLISLHEAIPMILGCNIGTCFATFKASFGATKSAKKIVIAHILFNIIGTIVFLPILAPFEALVLFTSRNLLRQIAHAHTLFNVFGAALFPPLSNNMENS